jgi:MEMO1 family protein
VKTWIVSLSLEFTQNMPIPPVRYVEAIPFEEDGRDLILLKDPLGFSDSVIAISHSTFPLIAMFDGIRTVKSFVDEIEEATGTAPDPSRIINIVNTLDNAYMLQNEKFNNHRLEIENQFKNMSVREATLSGGGYPDNPQELRGYLENLLLAPPPDDLEPETVDTSKAARGLLVPHIDFMRGGKSYGRAYKEFQNILTELNDGPLLVGVIGVAHNGSISPIVTTAKDFETPFGVLENNKKAIKTLKTKLGESVFTEEWLHKDEHSIELQTVWVKHIIAEREVTFLPILTGIFDVDENLSPTKNKNIAKIVETLKQIELEHDGPVVWIASVDFAHVGTFFDDPEPVSKDFAAEIEVLDMEALKFVKNVDAEGWWKSINEDENARRVCGRNATYLALKLLEGSKGVIVDYQQAVSRNSEQMVSFASAIFQ